MTTLMVGIVWVESSVVAAEREDSEAAVLKSELRRQEERLDRRIGRLARVGAELEESQGRVDAARARQKELGRRARELDVALQAQKTASVRSRSRLEDRIQVAYKGGEVEGLLLLLTSLFGENDERGKLTATLHATRLTTESSRSIQTYKDAKQSLRSTLRQLEEREAEYRKFGEEGQALVEELEVRESELRASVEGLGLQRGRMEERLAQLEAEEEAGLLDRPPATGTVRKEKTRDRSDVRDDVRGNARDDGQNRDEGRARQREQMEQARERELEIARDDIASQPVEPIPYEEYVRLYRESAERYGFARDWYVLAAVGKIESNHGENIGPSGAGAMGPMQFLPSTWRLYGVDGDGDGEANIMDPEDAIPAAAAYLRAGGAPDDWYAALFTYNRAGWYVEEVLAIAESYRRIHGDDSVGPYLEPATTPTTEEASPRAEPVTRPEDASDGGGEVQQEERPPEDVPSPSNESPRPPNDGPDAEEETTVEPESPAAADEATVEQYRDQGP